MALTASTFAAIRQKTREILLLFVDFVRTVVACLLALICLLLLLLSLLSIELHLSIWEEIQEGQHEC